MKDLCRFGIEDCSPVLNMRIQIAVFLAVTTLSTFPLSARSANKTPVGRWQTVSDATGKNKGVVQIVENGGQLLGRLVGGANPAEFETRLCDKCPGDRHGQPMKGLLILSGLHQSGDEWGGRRFSIRKAESNTE